MRHLFITPGLLARIFFLFFCFHNHTAYLPFVFLQRMLIATAKFVPRVQNSVVASGYSESSHNLPFWGVRGEGYLLFVASSLPPPPGSVAALRLIVSADESQVHAPRRGRRVRVVSQIASRFQADVPRSLEPSARSGTQSHFAPHFTSIGAEKRAP